MSVDDITTPEPSRPGGRNIDLTTDTPSAGPARSSNEIHQHTGPPTNRHPHDSPRTVSALWGREPTPSDTALGSKGTHPAIQLRY